MNGTFSFHTHPHRYISDQVKSWAIEPGRLCDFPEMGMICAAHKIFRVGAIVGMALLWHVVVAAGPAHAAPRCEPQIKAHAQAGGYVPTYVKKQIAKLRAVSNWRDKTKKAYGSKFIQWSRAEDKSVRCDVALGQAHCIAKAKPCPSSQAGSLF